MFTFFKKKSPPTSASSSETPSHQHASPQSEDPAVTHKSEEIIPAPKKDSWLKRIKAGLSKTRAHFEHLFRQPKLTEADIEQLEETLLLADCGLSATEQLITDIKARFKHSKEEITSDRLQHHLIEALVQMIEPLAKPFIVPHERPFVVTLVGVNGAGKTTSIGKLAHYFQTQHYSILLAAGDTFRAAAQEQIQAWGKRNQVTVIGQAEGDSASVIYDAISSAEAKNIDIVIADTAGRLPTQKHLLAELSKIHRVIQKKCQERPHEVLLVLDGTNGQNVLSQIELFNEATLLTGLIITKLDGSAKGGIIAAIAQRYRYPIYFLGMGERKEDLCVFNARAFAEAMIGK